MSARAPLDVDLEDKLIYGLTPMRLAYVVAALVLAFALWSSHWAPPVLRAIAASSVIVLGAAAGWGRWRGRPADRWAVDVALFAATNYRIEFNRTSPRWQRWTHWYRNSSTGGEDASSIHQAL